MSRRVVAVALGENAGISEERTGLGERAGHDRSRGRRSDSQVDRRRAQIAEHRGHDSVCPVHCRVRGPGGGNPRDRPLPSLDPAFGPEAGISGRHGVPAHGQCLCQLALGWQRAPVDEIALLGEPAQSVGQAPEQGPVLVLPPAEEAARSDPGRVSPKDSLSELDSLIKSQLFKYWLFSSRANAVTMPFWSRSRKDDQLDVTARSSRR